MKANIIEVLEENPIVAAIKDNKGLEKVLTSSCEVIFVLYGDICSIGGIVQKLKDAGKYVFVDIDLVEGTSTKEIVVDFMKNVTKTDGIISSKASIVRAAKEKGFFTIHRFFLIDSKSFKNLPKQYSNSKADIVEILPGAMPKVLGWVQEAVKVPIIASGLVCDKEDVLIALRAGAIAVSSTNEDVWDNI
ncbi:glycerol-3-phosphate responsive antiterminator [Carnobacterium gallinarum]|uniref:glycerol-3-phosphate responsive antiterminator n=1 Tax=Carnobacterium gallinarum TaxID=2749 RepID=UPI0005593E83|nr:glycerol-3-phosphate responsive antiterminator [Carnobacterium gallinarum]